MKTIFELTRIYTSSKAPDIRNKIKDNYFVFPFGYSKATPKLLNENPSRMCYSLENDNIHIRNIDAFIEDIYSTYDLNVPISKVT